MARQPLHPPQHGADPSTRPDGAHQLEDELRHAVGVAWQPGVLDRILGQAVLLVPGRSPGMQLGNLVRGFQSELSLQVVAQEVVVAVPLPVTVEGKDQHVPADEVLERRAPPVVPATASHNDPQSRVSTEVRTRKRTSSPLSRGSSSERR